MNLRYILLSLTAVAAPLCAQQTYTPPRMVFPGASTKTVTQPEAITAPQPNRNTPAEPAASGATVSETTPPQTIRTNWMTPRTPRAGGFNGAQSVTSRLEARMQDFGPLALLQPSISDFIVLSNVGDNLRRVGEKYPETGISASGDGAVMLALDDVALAISATSPETKALLADTLTRFCDFGMQLSREVMKNPNQTPAAFRSEDALMKQIIETMGIGDGDGALRVRKNWKDAKLPTCYCIITFKPGKEDVAQQCYEDICRTMRKEDGPMTHRVDNINGFSGIRQEMVTSRKLGSSPDPVAEKLLAAAGERSIYFLARKQNNAVMMVICEDPALLKTASSPSSSLLASDKLARYDAAPHQGRIATLHLSEDTINLAKAISAGTLLKLTNGVTDIFREFGREERVNKGFYDKAASALGVYEDIVEQFNRPSSHPSTIQIWWDKDVHIAATCDAMGARYENSTRLHSSVVSVPSTILYAESSPLKSGRKFPKLSKLMQASMDITRGISLAYKSPEARGMQAFLTLAEGCAPDVWNILDITSSIFSGLDGHYAMVVDSQLVSTAAYASSASVSARIPRFSFYAGVKERSQLSKGWDDLLIATMQTATKYSLDASFLETLPISSAVRGNATSYKLELPDCPPGTLPCLAISDKGLAIGPSEPLNLNMVQNATGKTPLAGSVFTLKLKLLAETLDSMVPAPPPSRSEYDSYSSRLNNIRQAVDELLKLSEYAEEIAGRTSIGNNTHTFNVDIRLK